MAPLLARAQIDDPAWRIEQPQVTIELSNGGGDAPVS